MRGAVPALVVLLAVALFSLFALGVFDSAEPETALDAWEDDDALDADPAGARLIGRPDAQALDLNPYATVADWRALVQHADPLKRKAWAARMAALADADSGLIGKLIEAMRESNADPRIRLELVQQALLAIGPAAVPPLVAALEDPEAILRERVATTLMYFKAEASAAVPTALHIAKADDVHPFERQAMITLLGWIGPASAEALPFLHAVLREEDADERIEDASVQALYRIGGATEELIETFSMVLAGEWLDVRATILDVIAREMQGDALPLLMDVLALLDDDVEDRLYSAAIGALEAIGKADPSVLTKLAGWIDEPPYHGMPRIAAGALARLGPAGQARLADTALGLDLDRRLVAVQALAENGVSQERLLPLLPALLESERSWHREVALRALSKVPTDAATTWPWLEKLAAPDAEGRDERALAILAIFALRDPPAEALKALDAALADERSTSAFNRGWIDLGPISDPALLQRALDLETSKNVAHRRGIAEAYKSAPADLTPRAIEGLLRLLGDEDVGVATTAAMSLGQMGNAGRRVLPILRARLARWKDDEARRMLYWNLHQAIADLTRN